MNFPKAKLINYVLYKYLNFIAQLAFHVFQVFQKPNYVPTMFFINSSISLQLITIIIRVENKKRK